MKRSPRLSSVIATLLVAALALESGSVRAEEGRATMHYDRGAVYPATGRMFNEPPHGATVVPHATGRYYYHQGSWYRQNGSHVVVVVPPPGLVVPFLPPFYSTFWFGGYPYFYANEVFYTWQPQVHGYVVTQPPATTDAAVTTPAAELFVYPMKGQDESQQSTDRYECHSWGVAESGFDPVKPQGGVDQSVWTQKREDYQNALAACLKERGYSVR